MRIITFIAFLALLTALVSASSHSAPLHNRGHVEVEAQHRPLAETMGTFTEEQPPCESIDERDAEDSTAEFISARKKARSAKLFRPGSNGSAAERAINRKSRQNRLSSSRAPNDEAEDEVESDDDDDDDEPIVERYDVDPATHPLP